MEPILEFIDVCFSYHSPDGETPALSGISFSVFPGEFIAVVGPSGCGNALVSQWKQIGWQPPVLHRHIAPSGH